MVAGNSGKPIQTHCCRNIKDHSGFRIESWRLPAF
jgi:hypothetical protein